MIEIAATIFVFYTATIFGIAIIMLVAAFFEYLIEHPIILLILIIFILTSYWSY